MMISRDEVKNALKEWKVALGQCEHVVNDNIDFVAYEVMAKQKRYEILLREYKNQGPEQVEIIEKVKMIDRVIDRIFLR